MKKILISSTTFLNDTNDSWKNLKKKYKLNFSPFGKVFYLDKKYSKDYWDGDRRAGYGGYKFIENYWAPVAQKLIKQYNLNFADII